MDEYISREEAIKELCKVYEDEYPTASGDFDEYASQDVSNVLRNIPAADIQPVKHGKWEMNSDYPDRLICNQCNSTYDVYFCKRDSMHYCPNCGSKNRMDGDSE